MDREHAAVWSMLPESARHWLPWLVCNVSFASSLLAGVYSSDDIVSSMKCMIIRSPTLQNANGIPLAPCH